MLIKRAAKTYLRKEAVLPRFSVTPSKTFLILQFWVCFCGGACQPWQYRLLWTSHTCVKCNVDSAHAWRDSRHFLSPAVSDQCKWTLNSGRYNLVQCSTFLYPLERSTVTPGLEPFRVWLVCIKHGTLQEERKERRESAQLCLFVTLRDSAKVDEPQIIANKLLSSGITATPTDATLCLIPCTAGRCCSFYSVLEF